MTEAARIEFTQDDDGNIQIEAHQGSNPKASMADMILLAIHKLACDVSLEDLHALAPNNHEEAIKIYSTIRSLNRK